MSNSNSSVSSSNTVKEELLTVDTELIRKNKTQQMYESIDTFVEGEEYKNMIATDEFKSVILDILDGFASDFKFIRKFLIFSEDEKILIDVRWLDVHSKGTHLQDGNFVNNIRFKLVKGVYNYKTRVQSSNTLKEDLLTVGTALNNVDTVEVVEDVDSSMDEYRKK